MANDLYIPSGIQQSYESEGIFQTGCSQDIPAILGHKLGTPG